MVLHMPVTQAKNSSKKVCSTYTIFSFIFLILVRITATNEEFSETRKLTLINIRDFNLFKKK